MSMAVLLGDGLRAELAKKRVCSDGKERRLAPWPLENKVRRFLRERLSLEIIGDQTPWERWENEILPVLDSALRAAFPAVAAILTLDWPEPPRQQQQPLTLTSSLNRLRFEIIVQAGDGRTMGDDGEVVVLSHEFDRRRHD